MRIVGGTLKGRIIKPARTFKARPTTDFAKENLFNILENRINWGQTHALDLFSGTGSISYELISRGCKNVTAIEQNYRHYKFINDNAAHLQITNLTVIRADVFRCIHKFNEEFNLVFADPPFDLEKFASIPSIILSSGIIAPDGLFILEHNKSYNFCDIPEFTEIRSYGSVNFSFFKRISDPE
jgi:16S rRNA (guanine(966)-N(2))-methyltransferase RsmD